MPLAPYGISPRNIRMGDGRVLNSHTKDAFADARQRYIADRFPKTPQESALVLQTHEHVGDTAFVNPNFIVRVAAHETNNGR